MNTIVVEALTRIAYLKPIFYWLITSTENVLELFQLKLVHSTWTETIVKYLQEECIKYSQPKLIDISSRLNFLSPAKDTSIVLNDIDIGHYTSVTFKSNGLTTGTFNRRNIKVSIVCFGVNKLVIEALDSAQVCHYKEIVLIELKTGIADLYHKKWHLKIKERVCPGSINSGVVPERDLAIALLNNHDISEWFSCVSQMSLFTRLARIALIMDKLYVIEWLVNSSSARREGLINITLEYGSGLALVMITDENDFKQNKTKYLTLAREYKNKRLVAFLEQE
jgi:hypothetical protein